MIDIVAVPERLEQQIGEPKHQDVLNRALAEVVVDPIDLGLGEVSAHLPRQDGRALQIESKGLLDHQARPMPILPMQTLGRQLLHDGGIVQRGHGQIAQEVPRHRRIRAQPLGQALIGAGVLQVTLDEDESIQQTRQDGCIGRARQGIREALARLLAPLRVRPGPAAEAEDARVLMQPLGPLEMVERRQQLEAHQVAGRAEDENGTGIQHDRNASLTDKYVNLITIFSLPRRAGSPRP